ncbi:hypothetical protein Tco_0963678 [Tanacetum coccineum]
MHLPAPNDLPETENNWGNALACSYQDPDEYKLLWQTGDMSSFINWFCKRIGKRKLSKADFQMEECHLLLTDQVDLVNPEGHRVVPDVSKPLPLGGPPGQVTIQAQYFFNKDVEYLVSGDKGRRSALSISKLKEPQYLDFGLEELVPADYNEYKISEADFKNLHPNDFKDMTLRDHFGSNKRKVIKWYGHGHMAEIEVRRADNKLYKFMEECSLEASSSKRESKIFNWESKVTKRSSTSPSQRQPDMTLEIESHSLHTQILKDSSMSIKIALNLRMDYLPKKRWSNLKKKRSRIKIKDIEKQLKERRIMRSFEKFICGERIWE